MIYFARTCVLCACEYDQARVVLLAVLRVWSEGSVVRKSSSYLVLAPVLLCSSCGVAVPATSGMTPCAHDHPCGGVRRRQITEEFQELQEAAGTDSDGNGGGGGAPEKDGATDSSNSSSDEGVTDKEAPTPPVQTTPPR